jgi:transcriptional antiterminator NusG
MEIVKRNVEMEDLLHSVPEASEIIMQEQREMVKAENWYALRVKSRHEFIAAEELTRRGIENFVPFVSRVRQWKDRKKVVDFPLFPGYLFVHLAPESGAFLNVVKTRGALCFITLEPGQPTAVSLEEITSLRSMLEIGEQIDVFPAFKEGTVVRVKRGPLSGAVGVLSKRKDHHMFFVNINILGRSVGLKICAEDVEQP